MIAHADESWAEAMLRTRPERRLGLLGHIHDLDRIAQRRGQRPADVEPLARLQYRRRLLQVLAAVEAHDHDGIALPQQFFDRIDELDVEFDDVGLPLRQAVNALGEYPALGRRGIGGNDALQPARSPRSFRIVE